MCCCTPDRRCVLLPVVFFPHLPLLSSQEEEDLPDDAVAVCQVGLELLDRLSEQPTVRTHADVGHPVGRHQRLHQPAQRVVGGRTRLTHKHQRLLFPLLLPHVYRH